MSGVLCKKIESVCKAFGVMTYPWPKAQLQAYKKLNIINQKILDQDKTSNALDTYILKELKTLTEPYDSTGICSGSTIEFYSAFCSAEKSVYTIMNYFSISEMTMKTNCWFPTEEENEIKETLSSFTSLENANAFLIIDDTRNDIPPTYFKTNDLTKPFQDIVNMYGIPRYKEINPAYFAVFLFPYLIGVMYGDIGHGVIIAVLSIWLIIRDIINSRSMTHNKFDDESILSSLNSIRFENERK